MNGFAAIILVCLRSVATDACDETNAIDILSTRVASEMQCTMGWQEVIARGALRDGLGTDSYLKTVCRRLKDDAPR